MDEQKDPRPDEEMQRQWREALEVDSFGNEHDIWLSGFNRGKQAAAISQLGALRDAVAALGGITSDNVPETVRAALSQPAAQGDSSHSAGGECGGVPQWQPIETAPKDGSWIVVLGCYPHSGAPETVRWFEDHWSIGGDGYPTADPVQWMPLPAAPKATP